MLSIFGGGRIFLLEIFSIFSYVDFLFILFFFTFFYEFCNISEGEGGGLPRSNGEIIEVLCFDVSDNFLVFFKGF